MYGVSYTRGGFSESTRKKVTRQPSNILRVVLDPLKPRVSCQNGSPLRRVEKGRYDFHIITFQDLKNTAIIAVTEPSSCDGSMAMKGNRHPVTDTGIDHLIKIISENIRRRMKAGGFKLLEHEEETVYRRKTRKVEVLFERDRTKGYYDYRVIINLDEEKKVPIKIQIYDCDDQLVESYGYENLNLNAGLTDVDFDPKNPEYRF